MALEQLQSPFSLVTQLLSMEHSAGTLQPYHSSCIVSESFYHALFLWQRCSSCKDMSICQFHREFGDSTWDCLTNCFNFMLQQWNLTIKPSKVLCKMHHWYENPIISQWRRYPASSSLLWTERRKVWASQNLPQSAQTGIWQLYNSRHTSKQPPASPVVPPCPAPLLQSWAHIYPSLLSSSLCASSAISLLFWTFSSLQLSVRHRISTFSITVYSALMFYSAIFFLKSRQMTGDLTERLTIPSLSKWNSHDVMCCLHSIDPRPTQTWST